MFYQGTLQEGISTAVGQQKLVLCFVTNENDESQTWENDYLQDATLKDVVTKQAVALRLMAGSEEAGYLAQIFPLPQTPTIVIMKHGELKEYIAAGTTKEDFLRRVRGSFEGATAVPSAAPETLTESPPRPPPSSQQQQQQSAASNVASSPSTVERSDAVQRVLEDRAAKLQAAKEAAERKAREEREEQKAKPATPASKQAQEQAELVRKSKQQATEERRRILRRIQDDKDERRKQAQDREQQRLERQASSQTSSPLATPLRSERSPVTQAGAFTSVQVRLLDGSTIRSRFETASPVTEVRKWVEEKTPDVRRIPFGFKQLLTPLPNRSIDETEEEKSFGDLGLSPSSTLILVPIRSYATAYNDPSQGVLSRVLGLAMDFLLWVAGVFGVGGGEGGGADASNASSSSSSGGSSSKQTEDAEPSTGAASGTAAQTKKGNVKRLEDTRDRLKDQQLYNGNSLNFEPRPDEDEKS
ncbi:UBX domain-containing protein [Moelleriella libera RCEF 2490]|uniref:UBX domain-containing protein 2 n=1 Tax=Moelleriella libera RCEF 2490 TaxID=1081109 RepID=A0A162INM8_9HYPO|nr:UBX domain-containing protein [Moelleriella libera RCEF 2490]